MWFVDRADKDRAGHPIVLHHGERGWTEPVSLRELYDAPEEMLDELQPFLPELRFLLIDLAPQEDAALRALTDSAVVQMTLWAFKHARHDRDVRAELHEAGDLMRATIDAPSGLPAFHVLMRYVLEVTGTPPADVQVIVDQLGRPEASEIVMTAAEQLRQEGRQQGQKQGREQAQRENLLTLLSRRFGPLPAAVGARVHSAQLAQLQLWFDRGITAPSLDAVFADEP